MFENLIKKEFEVSVKSDAEQVLTTVKGPTMLVDAGLMSLIETVAKQQNMSMIAKLDQLKAVASIRQTVFGEGSPADGSTEEEDEEEDCDGDCEHCDKAHDIPEELKEFFTNLFGKAE